MRLFAFLLFFITTVNSAVLIDAQHPIYVFKVNNEILMCKFNHKNVICYSRNSGGITVMYTCTPVPQSQGFIKNCYTKPTINLD